MRVERIYQWCKKLLVIRIPAYNHALRPNEIRMCERPVAVDVSVFTFCLLFVSRPPLLHIPMRYITGNTVTLYFDLGVST